jgi:hypothetical protein
VVFQIVEVSRGLEVHIYGRNVIDVDWGLVVRLEIIFCRYSSGNNLINEFDVNKIQIKRNTK